MKKLKQLTKEEPKIKKIYDYAKTKYDQANLNQHNFEHVIRNLFIALVIADTEKNVNYSVLVSGVLLHDIGFTERASSKDHALKGAEIIKRDLPEFGFSENEIKEICHCVKEHSSKPKSLEAKILFDADLLEKSDFFAGFYRAQNECKMPLDKFINGAIKMILEFKKNGFYTEKAREIDNGGLARNIEHFENVKQTLKNREDLLTTEKDVW